MFVDTFILSDQFRFKNITALHWQVLKETITAAVQVFDWVIVVGDKSLISADKSSSSSSISDINVRTTLRFFLKEMKVDVYLSGSNENLEVVEVRHNEKEQLVFL